MVAKMTKTAGTVREIASVCCSSAGIVFLLFSGILFLKANTALAGGTACTTNKPSNCGGKSCATGSCHSSSTNKVCYCSK